jgi:N-acetylglutamate synthase-like GNAT family acetyltransferase
VQEVAGAAVVRSLAIRPDVRRHGLGVLTVARAAGRARAIGATSLWAFTETAEPFFTSLGFVRVAPSDVPAAIASSPAGAAECAATAAAMFIDLSDR